MIDSIIGQLKDEVAGSLKEKAGVDDSQVNGIMDVVKNVAGEKIGKEMLSGNLSDVLNLFSDKANSSGANSLQTSITSGVVNALADKLGMSKDKAEMVTNMVIPALMKFVTKKNSETSDDDASPLTEMFGGSDKLGGLGKKLGGLFG